MMKNKSIKLDSLTLLKVAHHQNEHYSITITTNECNWILNIFRVGTQENLMYLLLICSNVDHKFLFLFKSYLFQQCIDILIKKYKKFR
jgi:hypothetical protein